MAALFDTRPCELGEGALWHPERQQLFWFDILGRRLLSRTEEGPLAWMFPEIVSAAGWIDRDRLLVASETSLSVFDLSLGTSEQVTPFLADRPDLRCNDGRADPWGGFWIGGMGKKAERDAGGIWRLYQGELRQLFAPITIPNSISFTPDRRFAHFSDSQSYKVWRVALDEGTGWPKGDPEVYLDLRGGRGEPDGAVCDATGNLWVAEWGASRVACYDRSGRMVRYVEVGGRHSSCPAFGGPKLDQLFVTTARENLDPATLAAEPHNGCVFTETVGVTGLPEPRVHL